MTLLAQLQQRVAAAIVGRDAGALNGLLAGNPEQAAARVFVYINNHHLGLREALSALYPVVRRLLGEHCFEQLARDYVSAFAKSSGNLLDYGGHLADFIAASTALDGLPYLPDMARLEWCRHRLFHAADSAPEQALSLACLAALDTQSLAELRLQWQPAACLYQSRFPVLSIWQSNQLPQPTPVSLDEGGVRGLLHRTGLALSWLALSAGEFAFCDALSDQPVCVAAELARCRDPHFDLALTLARCHPWLHAAQRSTP